MTVPSAARIKELVGRDYDQSAAAYAAYAEPLVYRYLCAPLARAIGAPGGAILDVASGTGALGKLLPGAVAADLAHGQLVHNPLPLRVVADAERLPFPDSAFAAAASAFGIAHFPHPEAAVAEMARVARLVGLLTWVRPETPFAPKRIVLSVVERHAGAARTPAGNLVDEMADRVGSEEAIAALLRTAGLHTRVRTVRVEVPWPGTEAFIRYRLALAGVSTLVEDPDAVAREAAAEISRLEAAELRWCPSLVLGIGRRRATERSAGRGV